MNSIRVFVFLLKVIGSYTKLNRIEYKCIWNGMWHFLNVTNHTATNRNTPVLVSRSYLKSILNRITTISKSLPFNAHARFCVCFSNWKQVLLMKIVYTWECFLHHRSYYFFILGNLSVMGSGHHQETIAIMMWTGHAYHIFVCVSVVYLKFFIKHVARESF